MTTLKIGINYGVGNVIGCSGFHDNHQEQIRNANTYTLAEALIKEYITHPLLEYQLQCSGWH